MSVANIELCKELYRLSGWDSDDYWWIQDKDEWFTFSQNAGYSWSDYPGYAGYDNQIPAYDLGYLIRKIATIPKSYWSFSDQYSIRLWFSGSDVTYTGVADTPEDAACKLAIELFKQNVITKET